MPNESGSPGHAASQQPGDDKKRAPRAFFGRRKGHPLKPRQAALFDALLPRLALDFAQPAPADLRTLFATPVDDLRLEIGFGGAEHLAAQAQANPGIGFIGCEPFVNGMAKALAAIDALKLDNIRLHHGDATAVLGWLPAGSLQRVELIHPDPWPKRRHWKRRFIQHASIAAIARVLRAGGELRFASDWPDYVAWTLERLIRSPDFIWTAERAGDWRVPWPDFSGTRYQDKALREGREPYFLAFRRR